MTDSKKDAQQAASEGDRTEVSLRYRGASRVEDHAGGEDLRLVGNEARDNVRLSARLLQPLLLREALSTLHAVVESDFRYVPKDRSAYLAYQRQRQKASASSQWNAQLEYFSWLSRNDPMAFLILDPIVSVCPDELAFEVFSKDESSYARLAVDYQALELDGGDVICGVTNIDFSKDLYDGLQHLRTYRQTRLDIGGEPAAPAPGTVALATSEADESVPRVLEKKIRVPDSWIRGFLQVQSAPTLPRTRFRLLPIDLYNVLRQLRLHADRKRQGRGLRVELVPGEPPRLVLEPWETVLTTHAGPYVGEKAEVIRIWGRRRLMLLRRLMPFVQSIEVHLLGSGLPSFWVLRAGEVTLTLGMSGFTAANWSQAISFDLLLPRRAAIAAAESAAESRPVEYLRQHHLASVAELVEATGHSASKVLEALQTGCQEGLVIYDLARDVYRYRPLLDAPLPLNRLAFRNPRERRAHDLLAIKDAVRLVSENHLHGTGLELTGRVLVEAEKREYRPQLLIDPEGRVKRGECTCKHFRQHGLKEGPCAHLVTLRILHQRRVESRAKARAGKRAAITVETRTYVRRHERGEDVYLVSFDGQRLRIEWGLRGQRRRLQNLVFNTVKEAREAYFDRVDRLVGGGYLDASVG